MKNKIYGILAVMLLVGTLYGCAEAEQIEQKAEPLEINTQEQYIESEIEVYSEGVKAFEYSGEIEVKKWGFNGVPEKMIIRVGDTSGSK